MRQPELPELRINRGTANKADRPIDLSEVYRRVPFDLIGVKTDHSQRKGKIISSLKGGARQGGGCNFFSFGWYKTFKKNK